MSRYKRMTLTSKGWQMLAKMMKRECDMVVTRAAIGCGSYDGTEDLSLAEGLKGFIRSFGISSFEREDDQLLLRFVASNFDLETNVGNETDYYLTEIGIYARESEADEDFLYAIAVADVPAFLPAYDEASPVTITFSTYVYIGNEGDVLIHADPTAYALAADLQAHEQNEGNPHKVTKKQVGLEYADNTPDLEKPVSEAQRQAIADAQAGAKQFTLQKIADLINGAPETLDTLKEVADAIAEHNTVMEALDAAIGKKANQSDLEVVAFSGDYNDLTNKPQSLPANGGTAETISETLPISKGGTGKTTANDAANVLINGLTEGTDAPVDNDYYVSQYVNGGTAHTSYHRRKMSALWNYIKSKLAAVATSGSYNDLSNKPTIPTVGNGTVAIKQAGVLKGTFTTNQSGNTTIELTDNNTNTWRGIQNNLTSDSTTESLSAAQGKALNTKIDELKKSASDGKSAVASAVTEMGVSTQSDAAYSTMATNIKAITPVITGSWNGTTYTATAKINGKNAKTVSTDITTPTADGTYSLDQLLPSDTCGYSRGIKYNGYMPTTYAGFAQKACVAGDSPSTNGVFMFKTDKSNKSINIKTTITSANVFASVQNQQTAINAMVATGDDYRILNACNSYIFLYSPQWCNGNEKTCGIFYFRPYVLSGSAYVMDTSMISPILVKGNGLQRYFRIRNNVFGYICWSAVTGLVLIKAPSTTPWMMHDFFLNVI